MSAHSIGAKYFSSYFVTCGNNSLFHFSPISEESLQDVANLKKLLMKALTLFIDAAESYSKVTPQRSVWHMRSELTCRNKELLWG